MFFKLLMHQSTAFWRGRNRAGGIIAKAVMILIYLYLFLTALGLGFFMGPLLSKVFPGEDPTGIFMGFILYYFMFDFLLRIQLQELPTLSVQPYLTLNIRKPSLVSFLNTKTLFSFFNLIPLFLFLPFVLTSVSHTAGIISALAVAGGIVALTLFNNFFAMWLKRRAGSNASFMIIGVAIVLALAALDYFGVISVRVLSRQVFGAVLRMPYLVIIFLGTALTAYLLNRRYLMKNLYIEELSVGEQSRASTDFPLLNRFGSVGQLAASELKLILRHKRSKGSITMSLIFVFYGLLFYKDEALANDQFSIMLFAAIFMTGIFQIAYGQFMFAWQSAHFDGLMANRINFTDFIKAKFLLFTLAATLVTMITMVYGFISWKLILLHLSVCLYNIGFGAVIVLFLANYNRKALDLSKGGAFNWQGVGATQWILAIPLIVIPFLIYMPFGMSDAPYWGLIAIGLFGMITLAMRDLWVRWLTKLFIRQRYKIAEGFRE